MVSNAQKEPHRLLDAIVKFFVVLASIMLFLMMLIIVYNVVGRYVADTSIPGSAGITRMLLVGFIALSLPFVSLNNRHIKIDLIQGASGSRLEKARKIVIEFLNLLIFGMLSWFVFEMGREALMYDDVTGYLQIPIAPVVFMLSAMLCFSALTFLYRMINEVILLGANGVSEKDRSVGND